MAVETFDVIKLHHLIRHFKPTMSLVKHVLLHTLNSASPRPAEDTLVVSKDDKVEVPYQCGGFHDEVVLERDCEAVCGLHVGEIAVDV